MPKLLAAASAALISLVLSTSPGSAQKKYDPGASDTEIKLGQTMPYSGPLSGFITLAKAEIAYFQMINDLGGVNGRKITMISLDDGFSPPKTVEQTRRLVEQDQVLAISGSLGTATNASVQKYLNTKKVPQLFLATGASRWNDPENFPYTMTLTPIYQAEARIYAAYMLKEVKDPKVAVLYQNDDFGKDFLKGFRDRLGAKAAGIIVREVSYEVTDATVDSQIIDLASTKANVFLNISTPKFAVQAIRKVHELGWKPLQFIDNPAASIGIARSTSKWVRAADMLFMSPLLLPALAFGFAALVYINKLGLSPDIPLLVLGHVIVCVPFVLRTTIAALSQLDPALLDASHSLGGSQWMTFRRVILPLIAPGLGSGAFLAFMASFDNVPVSLFLADERTEVLPIHLWQQIDTNLDVRTAAASGLIVIFTIVLMLIAERMAGFTQQMR